MLNYYQTTCPLSNKKNQNQPSSIADAPEAKNTNTYSNKWPQLHGFFLHVLYILPMVKNGLQIRNLHIKLDYGAKFQYLIATSWPILNIYKFTNLINLRSKYTKLTIN